MTTTTVRVCIFLPDDLLDRARNVAVAAGRPLSHTIAALLTHALALHEAANGPVPPRGRRKVMRGRPRKVGSGT